MNKKLKIVLILVSVYILFLGILLAIPTIDNYISDQSTIKYKEYEKIGDDFVYEFQYAETYTYLEEIVEDYNKEYGYDTNNKILMGKDEKETVFAEYDENSITIYCEDIMNGKLTDNEIEEYLEYLFEGILNCDYDSNYDLLIENFNSDLTFYHEGMSKVMRHLLFCNNPVYIYPTIRLFHTITSFTDLILVILVYCYLVYIFIYLVYCLIYFLLKKKKKEITNIKGKVVLYLLSVLYLLVGGISGIISFILSMLS